MFVRSLCLAIKPLLIAYWLQHWFQHAVDAKLSDFAFDFPALWGCIVMGSPFVQRLKDITVRVGRCIKESGNYVKTPRGGRHDCCEWVLNMCKKLFGTVPSELGTQCR
jgi:hypothetical protein